VTYLYIVRFRLLRGWWRWRKRTTSYSCILLRGRAGWFWKQRSRLYDMPNRVA